MTTQCRYCPTLIEGTRDVCSFHMKTRRLVLAGRCIWCTRSPDETDFPTPQGSYCVDCLTSRIRQRGGERARLNHWLSKARAAA